MRFYEVKDLLPGSSYRQMLGEKVHPFWRGGASGSRKYHGKSVESGGVEVPAPLLPFAGGSVGA